MNLAIQALSIEGLILEFGVFKGASIKYLAKSMPHKTIHGFDSFEGLQEAWVHYAKGAFDMHGQLPKVPKNVRLHKGNFDETIPAWLSTHDDIVAFVHIDCDLGSSTETIFAQLEERIQPGTIIVFDDYFNFQDWEKDGHRVFTEYVDRCSVLFEPIGYGYKELAVRITSIRHSARS